MPGFARECCLVDRIEASVMGDEQGGARDLNGRVEQLYRRVSTGLHQDRTTSVWLRFEVRADSDTEALALVRDQVQTGVDRGATLREARVGQPRWDAVPVIPVDQSAPAGEASF
jgi:hypothetical protein